MCGIVAIFLKRPLTPREVDLGRRATRMLAHRGPDAQGEWMDAEQGVYLGHRRLRIIDLSAAANQPMRRASLAIAFNGELYNYRALRQNLLPRQTFITDSDTEVLLAGWQEEGAAFLDRIDGMFALALWDGEQGVVAVDPFGEKPLFWAEREEGIYVASEIAPLAALLDLPPELDQTALAAYLSLGYVPAPGTAFRHLHRLLPASRMVIRRGVAAPVVRYWTPPRGDAGRGKVEPLSETQLDRIEILLADSARDRLHAHVPVCLFLSGGIDSALVAALARKAAGIAPPAITVAFPRGDAANESEAAAETAALAGLDHEILVSADDPEQANVRMVLELFSQPNDNISALPVLQIARAARARYTVALTGMGGDEIFFGYGKHLHFYLRRHLYHLPQGMRRLLGGMAGGRQGWWGRQADLYGVADDEAYLAHKNSPAVDHLRRLPGWRDFLDRSFGGETLPVELAVPYYERDQVMPNCHLTAQDHASMRASLELRTPFLNRGLVEALAQWDPRALIAFGQKSILRRLAARHFPESVISRKKSGFVFPHDLFVSSFPEAPPEVPGVDPAFVAGFWPRRNQANGWRRLAIRLMVLRAFWQDAHRGGGG